jgi:hypothetical protein
MYKTTLDREEIETKIKESNKNQVTTPDQTEHKITDLNIYMFINNFIMYYNINKSNNKSDNKFDNKLDTLINNIKRTKDINTYDLELTEANKNEIVDLIITILKRLLIFHFMEISIPVISEESEESEELSRDIDLD